MPRPQRPYVRLDEDYIHSQTQSLSAQITDLENRLTTVRATTHDVGGHTAIRGTAAVDSAAVDSVAVNSATVDTAIQLMTLIRERKQYLNEFCMTRHGIVRRLTAPDKSRRQYRRTYF